MSGPIADVRAHVAAALAPVRSAIPGVEIYTTQSRVSVPCVVLLPGSPYVEPSTTWGAVSVGLDVRLIVGSTSDALARLDDLIDAAIAALRASNIVVGSVAAPTTDTEQDVLLVDIPTTTTWQEN